MCQCFILGWEKNNFQYFSYRMDDRWVEKITFGALCDFLEKLSSEPNKGKKREMLQRFLDRCRKECPKEFDLYPILRLLLPKLDINRSSYGIKETVFAKVSLMYHYRFHNLLKMLLKALHKFQ